ncbi:MAG: hypothetical protein U1E65_33220 [Myxococcota bacterium]
MALEILKSPPPVATKLAALDALDRLALNPSGWFTDSVLDKLLEVRKAILTDRFGRALEVLEDTRGTMESFVKTLKTAAESEPAPGHVQALERANAELHQCVLVLSWLDTRPAA